MENKTFDVNRRTVVRTAAWTAPAVAIAAGAPAYAATGEANLSGSTLSSQPTRNANGVISIPANTATFINSGGAPGDLIATVTLGAAGGGASTTAGTMSITDLLIGGNSYQALQAAGFVTVTGLGTSTVTVRIVEAVAAFQGGQWTLPYALDFVTNEDRAARFSVSVAGANGGTPTSFSPVDFAALSVANLSTSASTGLPTRSGNYIDVPPTKFVNTGTVGVQGARVTVTSVSGQAITKMEANHPIWGWKDLTDSSIGCTYEVAPGPGVTTVVFRTPDSGLGKMNVGPGGNKTSAASQRWTVAAGTFEFTSKIEPVTSDPVSTGTVQGIGTTFRPAPIA